MSTLQAVCVSAHCRHALERYDRVTTMKVMRLRSQETLSGRKEYIVLGCTSVSGEDVGCTGKVGWRGGGESRAVLFLALFR